MGVAGGEVGSGLAACLEGLPARDRLRKDRTQPLKDLLSGRSSVSAVVGSVFLIYEAFGDRAEPQVVGVASAAERAEELAAAYTQAEQYQWRQEDWTDWDSVRRTRPAVTGLGHPVEIWIVEVPLDEVRPFILETEALVYEDDE
jgi:hypothetical protein